MDTHLLTVNEAAEYVRVHPATVRRWIHGGQLPAARVGASFRIAANDLRKVTQPERQPDNGKRPDMVALMKRARQLLEEEARQGKASTSEEIEEIIKEARRGREDELLKHCR